MSCVTRRPSTPKKSLGPASDNRDGRVNLVTKHKFCLAVMRDRRLSAGTKAVAAELVERYNDHPACEHPGYAWPGFGRIARETSLDRQTVIRAIAQLEAFGYFEINHAPKGTRNRQSNLYRPMWTARPPTRGVDDTRGVPATSIAPERRLEAPKSVTRGVRASQFHSKIPSEEFHYRPEDKSACAEGKKERASLGDNAIVTLTLEAALNDLASDNLIAPKRGFELFLTLWPKPDRDPDRLRGAWINAVAKPKEDVRAILMAALLWNRFYRLFPDEFVPRPGWWLKHSGWVVHLPYGSDRETVESFDKILWVTPSEWLELIDAFVEEQLESPFEVLRETGGWPDDDWLIVRNAFNAVLSKGHVTADEIIRKTERKLRQCDEAGDDPPLLGWWLKRRFGSLRTADDEADDEDDGMVGACTADADE
ncbi:MAG TPA: helix-turn-helix domain-containing protein [Stellaceae bacterium]|nr:helix-turn-helix domain-containing protein [Stellaceae bacterium]